MYLSGRFACLLFLLSRTGLETSLWKCVFADCLVSRCWRFVTAWIIEHTSRHYQMLWLLLWKGTLTTTQLVDTFLQTSWGLPCKLGMTEATPRNQKNHTAVFLYTSLIPSISSNDQQSSLTSWSGNTYFSSGRCLIRSHQPVSRLLWLWDNLLSC